MDKIQEILSRSKPLDWEKETNTPDISNQNTNIVINKIDYPTLIVLLIVFILILSAFMIPQPLIDPSNKTDQIVLSHKISSQQSDTLKSQIRDAARCMDVHPNKLHAELKKIFGFYSISSLDRKSYDKILILLNSINSCQ